MVHLVSATLGLFQPDKSAAMVLSRVQRIQTKCTGLIENIVKSMRLTTPEKILGGLVDRQIRVKVTENTQKNA